MARTLDDTYFTVTPIHMWSYLGFYKYRCRQDDFSYLFETESFKLMRSLERLAQQDSQKVQDKANILISSFRVKYYSFIIYLYI